MATSKKTVNKKDPRVQEGNPEQDRENKNMDKAIKKESESLSYPETVNDADEKEVYETGHDNDS
jgi:hypothetical protein